MGLLSFIFGKRNSSQLPDDPAANAVHSLKLVLKLTADDQIESYYELERQIAAALLKSGAGQHEGHALVDNEYMITLRGPNADDIFNAISQTIEPVPLPEGSYGIKRYGEDDDPAACDERIDLAWRG